MKRIITKGNPKFNNIRNIIRNAQNELKEYTWGTDYEIVHISERYWNKLQKIFDELGSYAE